MVFCRGPHFQLERFPPQHRSRQLLVRSRRRGVTTRLCWQRILRQSAGSLHGMRLPTNKTGTPQLHFVCIQPHKGAAVYLREYEKGEAAPVPISADCCRVHCPSFSAAKPNFAYAKNKVTALALPRFFSCSCVGSCFLSFAIGSALVLLRETETAIWIGKYGLSNAH